MLRYLCRPGFSGTVTQFPRTFDRILNVDPFGNVYHGPAGGSLARKIPGKAALGFIQISS